MTDKLRITFTLPAPPARVYAAWLSAREHAAMTGGAATVDPRVGGRHSAFDGYAFGFTLALEPDRRVLQSWRTSEFPPESPDSLIDVSFAAIPAGTRVTLVHRDLPTGDGVKYRQGWQDCYAVPMGRYFAEQAARLPRKKAASTPRKGASRSKTAGAALRRQSARTKA